MKIPKIPRPLLMAYKILDRVVRLVFLLLVTYAVIFSLLLSWGAWKAYQTVQAFLEEVRILQTTNPERSKYMQALLDSAPGIQIKHYFVPLDSVSPWLRKAVLAAEDAGFYQHPGFDVRAIAEAMEMNRQRGRTVFGGSTITQQTAKNLFLSGERSWERKAKELVYALLMEYYLGKDRILELYLNYAQWGKNLFGCEAACREYYNKSCSKISMDAAINLAAVLASPGKHHPLMTQSAFMAKRRAVIYANLFGKDSLSADSTAQEDSTNQEAKSYSAPGQ